MIRKLAISIILATLIFPLQNVSAHADFNEADHFKWSFRTGVGFNSDGFDWTMDVGWFPNPFMGIYASVGATGEIGHFVRDMIVDITFPEVDIDFYDDDYDYDRTSRMFFSPYIEFRSPSLLSWRDQGLDLKLFASPGLIFATRGPDAVGHVGWLYPSLKCGIMGSIERVDFAIGYMVSNLYLYEGYREKIWNRQGELIGERINPAKIVNSVFLSIAFRF